MARKTRSRAAASGRFHRSPHAWAAVFRGTFADEVEAFGACLTDRVLPAFARLDDEAGGVQQAALQRSASSHYERDPASEYEGAIEEAAEWLRMMWGIRQGAINLYALGLYHLLEQQLLNFHRNVILRPGEERQVIRDEMQEAEFRLDRLEVGLRACGVELKDLPSYPAIRQLKLIANTVKHSEGRDCDKLRETRPELFLRAEDRGDDTPRAPWWSVYQPLAGEGLYLDEGEFRRFVEAARSLCYEIADALEQAGNAEIARRAPS